jgi:riboflavin biosynthesis pyrimidine reductase
MNCFLEWTKDACRKLKSVHNIQSILVEGGAQIIQSVLENQLCHQVIITLKSIYFGGYRSMVRQLPSPLYLRSVTVAPVDFDFVLRGEIVHDE